MLKDMTIEELEQLIRDARNMLAQRLAEKEAPKPRKKTGGRVKQNDD